MRPELSVNERARASLPLLQSPHREEQESFMAAVLFGSFALVATVAVLSLVLYLVAVLRGWFAALPNGFLLALLSAFVWIGLFAVWLGGGGGLSAAPQRRFLD